MLSLAATPHDRRVTKSCGGEQRISQIRVESTAQSRYPEQMQGDPGEVMQLRVVVGILGELEVRLGGQPLPVGHARQRSVLAALAVEPGHTVSVDGLIDRVWGERPPSRARSALRTYLTHLRRALAPGGITITHRSNGYLLDTTPDTVDLHRFHRLLTTARSQQAPGQALAIVEEALTLWRGEPLSELDTSWARAVRERLRQERAAAEADRVDWALACGHHGQLLPELTARAKAEPLDERIAGQVMIALYRGGRQADALQHYHQTRQRLVDELGTDPTPALQEQYRHILTADPTLAATPSNPRQAAVPRQLPAAPPHFTGRTAELAALTTALDPAGRDGTAVISTIAGAGGIGKTWLVLHWAHQHTDRFPDGQLFVDLHGFSPNTTPMDPTTAVRGFLDALGVDTRSIPPDPHAQIGLFRSLVADKRMLIVADNARGTDQVVPLLPGSPTCVVLVTSRRTLDPLISQHGAHHLRLGTLSTQESHDLLAGRLGQPRVAAEPAAVRELVGFCRGFSVALGIAAARAHTHPHVPLAEFAAELFELGLAALADDDPNAGLPAILSWSHQALTAEQQEVFALLGIAPGTDLGLSAAACLTGLSTVRAARVLRGLQDASLLDRDAQGRYRMHDLLHRYAADHAGRLPADRRDAALRRLLASYLHTAHAADRILALHRRPLDPIPLLPGCTIVEPTTHAAALAWFHTEHANLLAAQRTAARLGWHDEVWRLAWVLTTYRRLRGHLHEDLAAWRAGADATDHLGDPADRAAAHKLLGQAWARLGNQPEAHRHLSQALRLSENNGDLPGQLRTHHALALTWARQHDHDRASRHAHTALALARLLDDPTWEATALNAVGWYSAKLGRLDEAYHDCAAAQELFRVHNDHQGEGSALDSLGYIATARGDHDAALRHYRDAVALFELIGNTYQQANALDHLAVAHDALGDNASADTTRRRAYDLYVAQHRTTDADRLGEQPSGRTG